MVSIGGLGNSRGAASQDLSSRVCPSRWSSVIASLQVSLGVCVCVNHVSTNANCGYQSSLFGQAFPTIQNPNKACPQAAATRSLTSAGFFVSGSRATATDVTPKRIWEPTSHNQSGPSQWSFPPSEQRLRLKIQLVLRMLRSVQQSMFNLCFPVFKLRFGEVPVAGHVDGNSRL